MSANYWIKLYIEILNDSKMAILPDRLWRRVIEIFLAAGQYGNNGQLPETQQLAWLFRMNTDDLELDLKQIATTGIVQRNADGWLVTKFADRQAPVPGKERVKQFRDRQKKQQYYGDVTQMKRDVTQINRLTDNRLTETDTEEPTPVVFFSPEKILADASGLVTFPGNAESLQWVDVVYQMALEYGQERTTAAMKGACERWINTKNKQGRNYPKTNLNWIAWAQEELAASPADLRQKDVKDMTSEEFAQYLERINAE